jgi:hypothetical protein
VQGRVREHGVELALEPERVAVRDPGVDAQRRRRADHVRAGVDAHDLAAHLGQPPREHPVAAAEVEDPLARARVEEPDDRSPEIRHEPRVRGVARRLPVLSGLRRHGVHSALKRL